MPDRIDSDDLDFYDNYDEDCDRAGYTSVVCPCCDSYWHFSEDSEPDLCPACGANLEY